MGDAQQYHFTPVGTFTKSFETIAKDVGLTVDAFLRNK
jgi:hypothetical protein